MNSSESEIQTFRHLKAFGNRVSKLSFISLKDEVAPSVEGQVVVMLVPPEDITHIP